ncbi:MAG: ankyrin repeat domain-containing protein, partial [Alphaproteobacteria bacterium]|nr:ankyrin repeat domain-containing protein [Alphaproteobacteria bacterium]
LKSAEEIKELVIKGADVNAKDKKGLTALMLASEYNHKEVVELLRKTEEESKSKLKEELKEDSKSLSGSKDKKSNNIVGFVGNKFGGMDM